MTNGFPSRWTTDRAGARQDSYHGSQTKIISEKLKVDEQDLIRVINTQRINPEYDSKQITETNNRHTFNSKLEKAQVELLQLLSNS